MMLQSIEAGPSGTNARFGGQAIVVSLTHGGKVELFPHRLNRRNSPTVLGKGMKLSIQMEAGILIVLGNCMILTIHGSTHILIVKPKKNCCIVSLNL